MIERIITVGDRIDIVPLDAKEEQMVYKSEVLDVLEKDQLRIAMPFDESKLVVMSLNVSYKMYIYAESGLYECVGHVVDRFKSSNIYIAVLSLKTGLKRVQRREFFRLEKILDVDYRILNEEESQLESVEAVMEYDSLSGEVPLYKKGIAVDLSGGGARFMFDKAYTVASNILLRFYINIEEEDKPFYVLGKVVMSEKLANKMNQHENRLEFVRIKETEREKLVQYIFQEERKLRKCRKS